MKLATIEASGRQIVAVVRPGTNEYWPVETETGALVSDMVELLVHLNGGLERVVQGKAGILDHVKVIAPLRPRRNIFCVGKNYRTHAVEFAVSGFDTSAVNDAEAIPDAPIIFTKVPESVIASGETIHCPSSVSKCIDYEAELAVIIGRGGRAISRGHAMDYVFGFTIVNDVTARDLQSRHRQWFMGKSLDTFCPMGPWLVTKDEVDVTNLELKCWVNGELRQSANTSDLLFDIPSLIETISTAITLKPGDVIATGTPAGVGIGFKPPKFLRAGDEVAIEIAGLGRLVNVLAS